jgi:hypothetical protein
VGTGVGAGGSGVSAAASCSMPYVSAPICTALLRRSAPAFAATWSLTPPGPLPFAPATVTTQFTMLTVDHWQPGGAATSMSTTPPEAPNA